MERIDFREIANAKISSRLKQVATLIVAIVVGMIISVTVNAQSNGKRSHYKTYKSQRNMYANACETLNKKRNAAPKKTLRLASTKKKYKPMAEVDQPGTASRSSRLKREELAKREEVAQL